MNIQVVVLLPMVSADLWLSSLDLVWLLSFDVLYEIIKA